MLPKRIKPAKFAGVPLMQKPHPGEKPSEAFAAGAERSGASGRKLKIKSIDRLVGDNAKSSSAQDRDCSSSSLVFAVAFSDLYRLLPVFA